MTSIVDYEQKSKDELVQLQQQEQNISKLKEEINRLKLNKKVVNKETSPQTNNNVVVCEEKEDDSYEEDEMNFYLVSYRQLREEFDEEEIKATLPRKKHPKYKDILLRLSLESIKEIKEVKELLRTDGISQDEKELCNKIIENENKKIDYIKSKLLKEEKEEVEEIEEKNNIILVPTLFGNIRIIDDLEHIPNEYYDGFKELIESIIDGTFKNVKIFKNNNSLVGITEVKLFKIRLVFSRLSTNDYALITAFVKKFDTDKLYQESLAAKVREYRSIETKLKDNLNNPEFLEENEKYVKELWNILSPEDLTKDGGSKNDNTRVR